MQMLAIVLHLHVKFCMLAFYSLYILWLYIFVNLYAFVDCVGRVFRCSVFSAFLLGRRFFRFRKQFFSMIIALLHNLLMNLTAGRDYFFAFGVTHASFLAGLKPRGSVGWVTYSPSGHTWPRDQPPRQGWGAITMFEWLKTGLVPSVASGYARRPGGSLSSGAGWGGRPKTGLAPSVASGYARRPGGSLTSGAGWDWDERNPAGAETSVLALSFSRTALPLFLGIYWLRRFSLSCVFFDGGTRSSAISCDCSTYYFF